MTRGKLTNFAGLLAAFVMSISAIAPAFAQGGDPIMGVWRTGSGSEITIEPCGAGYCGRVTKAVIPAEIYEQYGAEEVSRYEASLTDALNSDPALRSRPIINLQILNVGQRSFTGQYSGRVYNPEDGNAYDGHVRMIDANVLELSGCVLLVLCQAQNWARVQ
jgi:uncharacterized protein (DUF2147 family)